MIRLDDDLITPTELLKRAASNAGKDSIRAVPRWVHVQELFGLGSTQAHELCGLLGLDPDEERGRMEIKNAAHLRFRKAENLSEAAALDYGRDSPEYVDTCEAASHAFDAWTRLPCA